MNRADSAIEALLERESARAVEDVAASLQRAGEDLVTATDVRRRIRSHPLLAAAIAGVAGWLGGPLVVRLLQRTASNSLTSGVLGAVPGLQGKLALASLRLVRPRR